MLICSEIFLIITFLMKYYIRVFILGEKMLNKITCFFVLSLCFFTINMNCPINVEAKFINIQNVHENMLRSKSNVILLESITEPIKIRVKKDIWDNHLYIMSFKDKKKIFEEVLEYDEKTWDIKEIQDDTSGRTFYVLSPGMERYNVKIMGYDPDKKTWLTYVKSNNFYSGVDTYDETINIDGNGNLKLSFIGSGWSGKHDYLLFWDNDTRWFGYKDLGIRYRDH